MNTKFNHDWDILLCYIDISFRNVVKTNSLAGLTPLYLYVAIMNTNWYVNQLIKRKYMFLCPYQYNIIFCKLITFELGITRNKLTPLLENDSIRGPGKSQWVKCYTHQLILSSRHGQQHVELVCGQPEMRQWRRCWQSQRKRD